MWAEMRVAVAAMALAMRVAAGTDAEVIRLEAGFATNSESRVFRDVPMPGGLADADGIEFDFRCDDLGAFSSFTIYFRSGGGWYVARLSPEHEGWSEHIRIAKDDAADEEGSPSGWRNVSAVRICGWRGAARNAAFQLSGLRSYRNASQVAVLRTESKKAERGSASWAKKLSATLGALGIGARQIADGDLGPDALSGMKMVALPYNPTLPPQAFSALTNFVAGGGKLLVCYVMPCELASFIGVKRSGDFVPASPDEAITGFLRKGEGLEGQPEFAPQSSWRAVRAEPSGNGEVISEWADRNRKPLGVPALIRTPNAIYMSHIWNGGVRDEQLRLMQSIVGYLAPELKRDMAEIASLTAQRMAEQLEKAKSVGLKAGEVRAAWCHTPYGYDGTHDWEASVRLMKDTGYTDLMANLCWGGLAFYRSNVLPVAEEVENSGDALDLCLAACRRHGVRLHVWKVCWMMHYRASASFRDRMQAAGRTQVDFSGKPMPRWFCPSNPENQRAEIDAMLELAERGVDGVHFDYIRYNDRNGCFCDGCRRRFEARCGKKVEDWPKGVQADESLKKEWLDFRRENISFVVRSVHEKLRGRGAKTLISAAVFSNIATCSDSVGQDWETWCRNGWLDFVCPMNYTKSAALFKGMAKAQMQAVGKVAVYPGIGLSCWPDDGNDIRRLAEQIMAARDLGLKGFTVFSLSARSAAAFPAFNDN